MNEQVEIDEDGFFTKVVKKSFAENGLEFTLENFDKVAEWAWGKDYEGIRYCDVPSRWNKFHAELFTITGEDDIESTFKRMVQEYIAASNPQ